MLGVWAWDVGTKSEIELKLEGLPEREAFEFLRDQLMV